MINNTSLLQNIAQLPQKSVSEMITSLLKNYASIHSAYDISGFPDAIKDVSYLEEAKQEMSSLSLNPNDQYYMLAFNANLSLIGKYELIFSNSKLVQSGLQFIFYKEHFQSFFEFFYSLKNIMELDFLIDRDALEDAYKKYGAPPPIPLNDLVEYYFAFYDIHPGTRKDVVAFAKKIYCLSESEQQKAMIEFLSEKLASGDVMNIEDLHVRNTIQGYMSLVSPANSETASLNIRIADMKWCNETYRA